ncbi:MAG TPA: hypothetical protein VMW49_00115 [Candidatus Dormibacteraeota bacterium]|nr:hypothetical protein [Candidatus Dormibacteraeota bacterium]
MLGPAGPWPWVSAGLPAGFGLLVLVAWSWRSQPGPAPGSWPAPLPAERRVAPILRALVSTRGGVLVLACAASLRRTLTPGVIAQPLPALSVIAALVALAGLGSVRLPPPPRALAGRRD